MGFGALAGLAAEAGTPFLADIGSGLLDEGTPWLPDGPPPWLAGEPGVVQTIERGADIVLYRCDKLLGGPQPGIAVGSSDVIATMASHPLARALRVPGSTLESVAVVLEMYAAGRGAEIPFWTMATATAAGLEERAGRVLARSGVAATIVEGASVPGAGSVPGMTIPGPLIRLAGPPEEVWLKLVRHDPPIVASRREGAVYLDLRTVEERHDPEIVDAFGALKA